MAKKVRVEFANNHANRQEAVRLAGRFGRIKEIGKSSLVVKVKKAFRTSGVALRCLNSHPRIIKAQKA